MEHTEPNTTPAFTYASISVAHQALRDALPPGSEVPSRMFIRRAAARGDIRSITIGRRITQYHLDDVRALVVIPEVTRRER